MKTNRSMLQGWGILAVILILRVTLPGDGYSWGFTNVLSQIPLAIFATLLGCFGVIIRYKTRETRFKSLRVTLHIIMGIILIEMIVWIIILWWTNYGLLGIFIPLLFLPYGYFFVRNPIKEKGKSKPQDTFDLYEQESEDVDVFEEYLNSQQKDSHYK